MEIIAFSSTPSPFPPARMSKIPLSVLIQAALDIRRNKAKEEDEKGVIEGVGGPPAERGCRREVEAVERGGLAGRHPS